MPVSEVGDAVIGRGFGLLHRRGSGARAEKAVDTAKFPYTLDNPAYGWFGLSSMVRVRIPGGGEVGARAIIGGRGGVARRSTRTSSPAT